MRLISTTNCILAVTGLAVLLLALVTGTAYLGAKHELLEREMATADVRRIERAIDSELDQLDRSAHDWASWDDTYQFMDDEGQDYKDENLTDDAFIALELNLIAYVQRTGKVVAHKAVDLERGQAVAFPTNMLRVLKPDHRLIDFTDSRSAVQGIVQLPEGILLVASRPVLTTYGAGPPRGALVMGRFLDASLQRQISQRVGVPFEVLSEDAAMRDADARIALERIEETHGPFLQPVSDTMLYGFSLLRDIDGRPAVLLKSKRLRTIYTQAKQMIYGFYAILIIASLAYLLVVRILLRKAVLVPVTTMAQEVKAISGTRPSSMRVHPAGSDELVELGHDINAMLDALAKSEARYAAIFDGANDMIFVHDAITGAILEVNRKVCDVLGYSKEELYQEGVPLLTAAPRKETSERVRDLMQRAVDGEGLFFDWPCVDKTGRRLVMEVNLHAVYLDDQLRVMAIARDISERRALDAQLEHVMHDARCMLWRADVQETGDEMLWTLNIINEEAAREILPVCEEGYASFLDAWEASKVREDRLRMDEVSTSAIKAGSDTYTNEYRCRRADGRTTWIAERVNVQKTGPASWECIGVCIDITEAKIRDQELATKSHELNINYQSQRLVAELLAVPTANVSMDEVLTRVLDIVLQAPWMPLEQKGGIFLVEEEGYLSLRVSRNLAKSLHTSCARVPFGHCLCGRAALSKEVQFADHVDDRHEITYEGIAPHGHYNVPIKRDGDVLGVLVLYLAAGHTRNEHEISFLETIGTVIADLIARKQSEERVLSMSKFPDENPSPVLRLDCSGTILFANTAAQVLLDHWGVMLGGRAPELVRDYVAGALETGEPYVHSVETGDRSFELTFAPLTKLNYVNIYSFEATEQRRLLRALEASEEKYRFLIENQVDLVVRVDAHGRFQFVSPSYCKLFGKAEDELLGSNFMPLVHEEDRDMTASAMAKLYHPPHTAYFEQRAMTKDGWRWIAWQDSAIVDENGEIESIVGVGRDITDIKRAELELDSFFNVSVDMLFVADFDGHILRHNPAFTETTGFSSEEVMSTPYFSLVHEDEIPALKEALDVLKAGAPISDREMRVLYKDGSTLWVAWSAIARADEGLIYVVARDITARKEAAWELHLLHTAIDQVHEAISITDRQGSIVYVNPSFEKLTEYSAEEVLGENPRILSSGHQSADYYRGLWETILSGKVWAGEVINQRKSGAEYTAHMTISPVHGPDGLITNFIAVTKDVTELKTLEESLRQAQKMEAVGELAGGIAHDFGNMLTVIQSTAELLSEDLDEQSPHRDDVQDIFDTCKRCSGLIRQLQVFSRRQATYPRIFRVNDSLVGLQKLLKRVLGERINLELRLDEEAGAVKMDPNHLEQLVVNLCVNAHDAMPDGGALTIETFDAVLDKGSEGAMNDVPAGDYVGLKIADTGSGMSADVVSRIFEPFFTTKSRDRGTGLGLAMVYGVVKGSGGQIQVHSSPGQGTTFTMYFPKNCDDESDVDANAALDARLAGDETILVVEDDELIRRKVRRVLERRGYTVLEAANGDEGIGIYETCGVKIHLVIADMIMPGCGGMEMVERLAQVDPHLKSMYISGYLRDEGVMQRLRDESSLLVRKPFGVTELLTAVREALDGRGEGIGIHG